MDDVTIDGLLNQVLKEAAGRPWPASTYRIQLHADFGFRQATQLVSYLHALGITDCYASPFLKARSGSKHGYDITEHNQINPEMGSVEDFEAWVGTLKEQRLGLILDMVPNHMAVNTNENPWWNDVLENGRASPFADFFDIAWFASHRPELQFRVLVPILGEAYGQVLEAQQLRLSFNQGAFFIHYFEHRFPVAPKSYGLLLAQRPEELESLLGIESPLLHEYQSILTAIKNLPSRAENEPSRIAEGLREKEIIKRRLGKLTAESSIILEFLSKTVAIYNGQKGDPHSFDLLEKFLDEQVYRLAYWRVAADEINYRRFFDVNDLAALSMEREEVFTATHELVMRLLGEGKITGLRIDHPDGLYDPRQYLYRLQHYYLLAQMRAQWNTLPTSPDSAWNDAVGPIRARIDAHLAKPAPQAWPLYVVVEKIIGTDERLPADWAIHGTSGYDFLNQVNNLFVLGENEKTFSRLYQDWVQDDTTFAEWAYREKILIMQIALSGELQVLAQQLDRLAQSNRWSRDFTLHSLRQALREIIACFPVYRSYLNGGAISDADRKQVLRAIHRAQARNPTLSAGLFNFVRDSLLPPASSEEATAPEARAEQRHFAGKFQQLTSPVMAKGVEDTAFYVYTRLLSLNEVGGNPAHFGSSPTALHRAFQDRQQQWPFSLSTTSTHDSKRSADVRARLNVLSELPEEWQDHLARWHDLNKRHQVTVDDVQVPDQNEEYFLYQTLLGAWPLQPYDQAEYQSFVERIKAYMAKALQEAKVHTSWINPNAAYDEAVQKFITSILEDATNQPFLKDLHSFQKCLSNFGMFNSLAETLLKITAPGVADFYQGEELWEFNLVDPDNRRPVDFARRQKLLNQLTRRVADLGKNLTPLTLELMAGKNDGRIKLYLTWRGLHCSRAHAGLFTSGSYLPAETSGPRKEHVFAFARQLGSTWALVAVPRLLTQLMQGDEAPCGTRVWQDTCLHLPLAAPTRGWRNIFTEEIHAVHKNDDGKQALEMAEICRHFPVALLVAES